MKRNWLLSLLSLIVILSMVLAACGGGEDATSTPKPVEAEPTKEPAPTKEAVAEFECTDEFGCVTVRQGEKLRIATALVISGANETLGIDSQRGVEIAIDDKQEVLGFPIELVAEDGQCSAEGGQTAATKIASDETIVAVVGHNCSSSCTPAAPIYEQAGFTMISPSCTGVALTLPESHVPSFVRTAHSDKVQGVPAAEFAYDVLGARKAATIHDGSPYAEQLQQVFADAFVALGGEITAQEAVNVGDTDMRPLLTSIAVDAPDFIYYPIFIAEGGFITTQAKEISGLENTSLMGADGMTSPDFVEAAGEAGNGMYFSGPDLSFNNPQGQAFFEKHEAKYGEGPISAFHMHAYDAANIIFGAVEEVGVLDAEGNLHVGRMALRDAIYATDSFDGITGSLTCDENGDCADPAIVISQLQNGEYPYIPIWSAAEGMFGEIAAPAEPEEPGEPKILRARLYGDIQNMDPAFQISENDGVVMNAVTNGLVRYCANSYDICYELAESMDQSEDGLEITFKLKEGVMWHNGYGEVTAEDVKYSFERMIDPELDAAYADDWATLDHVEVIDKYTGKIILTEPLSTLWTSTLPVSSGTVIPKAYVEEIGVEAFATNILGSGPYIYAEWRPQEMVILKKNPDYFGEEPYYDEIHLIPIEDDKAAEIALEAGDLDWARISIPSVQRFEDYPDLEVWKRPSLRYRWIAMNVEHPKLQDVNVRKAIINAIDVPSILAATYLGQVEQECALVPPGLIGYLEDAPCYQRDLDKAKEYMAAAGIDSLDLRLDLQDTTEYRTWGEIIQQNLKDIGINLELNPMESSAYWSTSFGEEAVLNNELLTSNYSMQPDPAWATMWFTCDQVTVWNTQSWCSEEYDELHRKGLVTLDNEEREQIYIEMQQLWEEAAQTVWITHGAQTYAFTPDIKPATTPHGRPQYHFFEGAE